MTDMVTLSEHVPAVEFAAGETVIREGGPSGSIWVLVSGALRVRKGDIEVNTITNPGAMVGEMSILQGTDHTATVETTQPGTLRHAADGNGLWAIRRSPSSSRSASPNALPSSPHIWPT
jgi:CRP/FNR family transcriptional regulator, cyclic AMP receptor protein